MRKVFLRNLRLNTVGKMIQENYKKSERNTASLKNKERNKDCETKRVVIFCDALLLCVLLI